MAKEIYVAGQFWSEHLTDPRSDRQIISCLTRDTHLLDSQYQLLVDAVKKMEESPRKQTFLTIINRKHEKAA